MADGIYSALSGAVSQAQALDIVANNLANVSTTGFKADGASFREELARQQTQRQVALDKVRPDWRSGPLRSTGRPLDVAHKNDGFFVISTRDGERYTRAGAFIVSPERILVTMDGHAVLGEEGPIQIQHQGPVRIEGDGAVYNANNRVGQLRVVRFSDRNELERYGNNLWQARPDIKREDVQPSLEAGALEGSNVNAVEAMTELIWITRAYESFHRSIEIFRSTDQRAVTDLGR